jgi:hypothetical protein
MVIIRVTREMAASRLADVAPEKEFWVTDGKVLKNLRDLESALRNMSDETFMYHSNQAKRDFSRWADEVIGDDKLGRDLTRAVDRLEAAAAVANRIAWLEVRRAR